MYIILTNSAGFAPSAHLDPRGHDVYGAVGYSLGITALPLRVGEEERKWVEAQTACSSGQRELLHARKLFCQFYSSATGSPGDAGSSPTVAAVVDCYNSAVKSLEEKDLHVQGLHELGNLMWYSGSVR